MSLIHPWLPRVSLFILSPACDEGVVSDACCTAGTPEPAGWTPREMHRILRGLTGLNFVYVLLLSRNQTYPILIDRAFTSGVDIVEVSPAYDTNGTLYSHICSFCSY